MNDEQKCPFAGMRGARRRSDPLEPGLVAERAQPTSCTSTPLASNPMTWVSTT